MPPPAGPGAGADSSAIVFHSPQLSQRPLHLLVTAPHDWQTKRLSGRAISVQPVLAEAPAVAVQPTGVVAFVLVAAQRFHLLLACRIVKCARERRRLAAVARADAMEE